MRIPLQEWMNSQTVDDEMLWKGAWGSQVIFARDSLGGVMAAGLEDYDERRDVAHVISTHTSKSILLPVYEFARPDLGLRVILRNNFYNWKLSVLSEVPIIAQFDGLFHTTPPVQKEYTGNPLLSVYFEGFPEDLIFGYLSESDGRRWSAEIWGDMPTWTTLFLLMRARGAIKPARWHTRESHRAELDAEAARRRAREAMKAAIEGNRP